MGTVVGLTAGFFRRLDTPVMRLGEESIAMSCQRVYTFGPSPNR
jgi:hypothetical protein